MTCREIEECAPLYLSGELEEDQHALIQAHLAQCSDCASQMSQRIELDTGLRLAVSDLPDATAVTHSVRARIGAGRARRLGAMAAIVVLTAILGYRMLRPESLTRLYADAALDHRLEVMEHQPRHWRSDPVEIEKLAARYELRDLEALAPAGYRLEHAKMCGIDGKAALHLVFANGSREVSVFVRTRSGNGTRSAGGTVKVGSEQLAEIQTRRLEAVVATDGPSGECLEFARTAASVLL